MVANKAGPANWAGKNSLLLGYLHMVAALLVMSNVPAGASSFFPITIVLAGCVTFGSSQFYR